MNSAYTPPMRSGKIVRWMEHLTDEQCVEFAWRISRTLAEVHDIDPAKIRATMIGFAEHQPESRP